jgi:hypothetical protein
LEVGVVAVAFDRMGGGVVVTLMDDRMEAHTLRDDRMEALTDLAQKL